MFGTFEANEILIVLHVEGKETLGYRAWQLYVPGQPLADYFTDTNACGTDDSAATLLAGGFSYVTSAVVDSWVGDDVIAEEPLIYNDGFQVAEHCCAYSCSCFSFPPEPINDPNVDCDCTQLYANIETGESHDYNRLTAKDHPELGSSGNYGWGLGALRNALGQGAVLVCVW